jgi:serine/threonine-protein kinase RsbW
MITLRLPAVFAYRDLVTRAVATGCKVASSEAGVPDDTAEALSNAMVSAVGEAFNNVVEHAYEGRDAGEVTIIIDSKPGEMCVTMSDDGRPFDIDAVPAPDLAALPESGMGLFIIRSFVDEVRYEPGPPNVLSLRKNV